MKREEMRDRLCRRILEFHGRDGSDDSDMALATGLADVIVADLWPEIEWLTEERDLAIAHDRQPYPTQWAYDQAVAALEKHRSRADQAERERDALRTAVERVSRLAREMRDWCSPYGVSVQYADRIEAELGDEGLTTGDGRRP
jgi:hypothetical protein